MSSESKREEVSNILVAAAYDSALLKLQSTLKERNIEVSSKTITQIVKIAKLTSFDVNKYGRRLMKINLGVVPTVANVYNQIAKDDGDNIIVNNGGASTKPGQTSDQIVEQLVVKTKYVTSFRDRINVKAAISPAKIQTITDSDGDTTE